MAEKPASVERQTPFGAARPVGRPARIDRGMIARAAYEVGLDGLTMKAVADHLGVSVPGLYHHVHNRDDLLRLGAEHGAAQIDAPVDHGQHWAVWLLEWAAYTYRAFMGQPSLLSQFASNALGMERMMHHLDGFIEVMVRQDFSASEALDAFELVSDVALGAALSDIRNRDAERSGHSVSAEYLRVLASHPSDALATLREVAATHRPKALAPRLITVLVGIAACRGEDWGPIRELAARQPSYPE